MEDVYLDDMLSTCSLLKVHLYPIYRLYVSFKYVLCPSLTTMLPVVNSCREFITLLPVLLLYRASYEPVLCLQLACILHLGSQGACIIPPVYLDPSSTSPTYCVHLYITPTPPVSGLWAINFHTNTSFLYYMAFLHSHFPAG